MSCIKYSPIPAHIKSFTISLVILGIMFVTTPAQIAKGANKFLGNVSTSGSVRSDFITYWNHLTAENECKWSSVEGTRDLMNWSGADRVANYARANGIEWTFHTLFTAGAYPSWIAAVSQDTLYEEIKEWFDAAAVHYPDARMVNVINDVYDHSFGSAPWKNALGGKGATGYDWIIKAFKMARERWPKAILFLNDYNNIEYDDRADWTVNLIDTLKKYNTPVDAIGCQAHEAYKIATSKVKANIDKLAATGLPVYISEYDIDQSVDSIQRKIMEEQFTMFWNHPKIIGITYYGYIKGKTWRTNTGLMSSDGIEGPALTWLKNFVKNNPNPPNDFSTTNVTTHFRRVRQSDLNSIPIAEHSGIRIFNLLGRISACHPISGSFPSSLKLANQRVLNTLNNNTGFIGQPANPLKNK
jgi:GH35 family endo-1,4-beta-xylanase